MNSFLITLAIAALAALNIGYYEAVEEADLEIIPFLKKHPTFQIKFYNIHANNGDIRKLERLTDQQRKWLIDYCRYRLGIDTDLTTQADVEACSKK